MILRILWRNQQYEASIIIWGPSIEMTDLGEEVIEVECR